MRLCRCIDIYKERHCRASVPDYAAEAIFMATDLTTLDPTAGYVTIINTYAVAPERAEALLELLVLATQETLRYVPGFISANFHMNLDERRW